MKRPKQMKSQQTKRLAVINDESHKPVIPIGPRFQAEIPDCIETYKEDSSSSSKWLGVRIWPNKNLTLQTKAEAVGKGRPSFCSCASPGFVECVKCHVSDRRLQLQSELGAAFWEWKFDEMGEDVSKFWNVREEQELNCIIKKSSPSQDNNFVKLALERFPTRRVETIVSYYFNVYEPRRMRFQTQSGGQIVDTDDDDDDDDDEKNDENVGVPCSEASRKRCRADGAATTQRSGKHAKKNFLKWRR